MSVRKFKSIEAASKFISDELATRAWADPKLAADFARDRTGTLEKLCAEFDLDAGLMTGMNIVLPTSPAGDMPFDSPHPGAHLDNTAWSCPSYTCDCSGGTPTITAECGCRETTTGGCSCLSIAGTPCWGCQQDQNTGL